MCYGNKHNLPLIIVLRMHSNAGSYVVAQMSNFTLNESDRSHQGIEKYFIRQHNSGTVRQDAHIVYLLHTYLISRSLLIFVAKKVTCPLYTYGSSASEVGCEPDTVYWFGWLNWTRGWSHVHKFLDLKLAIRALTHLPIAPPTFVCELDQY